MVCFAVLLFFLALGNELKLSHSTEVSVYDSNNKLCLYAKLMSSFSVTYDVAENKNQTVSIELPEIVSTQESTCGNGISTLKLSFGKGHSWTVAFTKHDAMYEATLIIFEYNLGDAATFPNALSDDNITVPMKPFIFNVGMGTLYFCKSQDVLKDEAVTQTLWNVAVQAFVIDGKLSHNFTSCAADTITTPAPTVPATTATTATPTTNGTTMAPATNATTLAPATTMAPATNSTTTAPVPTTTPVPTLPIPTTGKYSISPDVNGTSCLMASFGLRIDFKQGGKEQEINLDPSATNATGVCGENSSDLVLTSDHVIVVFSFVNDTQRFHLHALNVTIKPSTGVVFTEANDSLSLWQAALGSSYMCNKQQAYNITDSLIIHTFELRVQPFAVKKGEFSTAYECSMDDTSILIPIVVGAALAGLILIVLIAYVIGRRKTYVGYQTL